MSNQFEFTTFQMEVLEVMLDRYMLETAKVMQSLTAKDDMIFQIARIEQAMEARMIANWLSEILLQNRAKQL